VQKRLLELEADVDRLEDVERRLVQYEVEQTLSLARHAVRDANSAADAIASLQQRLKAASDANALANSEHGAAERALEERGAQIATEGQATAGLLRTREAAAEARALTERIRVATEAAQSEADCADESARKAAARVQQLETAEIARQLRGAVEQARQRLASAEAAESKRLAAAAVAATAKIGVEDVRRLDALATALAEAQARVETASVRLTMRPEFGGSAQVDDVIVEHEELVLSRDTTLHLFGYGEIDVRPGGGIDALEAAVVEASRQLAEALGEYGLETLDAAQAAWERRKTAEAAAELHAEGLGTLAPDGLQVLRNEYAAMLARVEQLPGVEAEVPSDELDDAKPASERAERAAEEARRGLAQFLDQLHTANAHAAVATERAEAADRTLRQIQDNLAAARAAATDETLAADRAQAATVLAAAGAELTEAKATLSAAEPEVVQLRQQRARMAEEAIAADINRLENSKIDLTASLRARGSQGLGEQLGELDGQIAYKEEQQARQRLEARAAALLYEVLAGAQREGKQRWLKPVHQRAAPYLKLLSGGGSIELDEDTLELNAVRRNAITEPFNSLSMGAREQIAVISRLALADILREGGHSSCVVLDDPLVNADQERLERMHLVLHRAATHQQILIFTCRERDFLGLGAPIFRI